VTASLTAPQSKKKKKKKKMELEKPKRYKQRMKSWTSLLPSLMTWRLYPGRRGEGQRREEGRWRVERVREKTKRDTVTDFYEVEFVDRGCSPSQRVIREIT